MSVTNYEKWTWVFLSGVLYWWRMEVVKNSTAVGTVLGHLFFWRFTEFTQHWIRQSCISFPSLSISITQSLTLRLNNRRQHCGSADISRWADVQLILANGKGSGLLFDRVCSLKSETMINVEPLETNHSSVCISVSAKRNDECLANESLMKASAHQR